MAAILVITVQGTSPTETGKNLQVVDNYMNNKTIFKLYSDIKVNPRIYYSSQVVISKDMHDIITTLRTDKTINKAIHGIGYSGSLNKA